VRSRAWSDPEKRFGTSIAEDRAIGPYSRAFRPIRLRLEVCTELTAPARLDSTHKAGLSCYAALQGVLGKRKLSKLEIVEIAWQSMLINEVGLILTILNTPSKAANAQSEAALASASAANITFAADASPFTVVRWKSLCSIGIHCRINAFFENQPNESARVDQILAYIPRRRTQAPPPNSKSP
jgi:hypothetical protein